MRVTTRSGWGLAALVAGVAWSAGADPARFVQDRFAIGFWVDPPADERIDERYAEIAEANFTLVLGGFGANDLDKVRRQLSVCEKYGLKALVWSGETPADQLPDGPACWGYHLRDEPKPADFPPLRTRVDEIRAGRPGRLAYINLYPTPSYPERKLGVATYDEYVSRFMNEVNTDVLSMDHYPNFRPDSEGRFYYCEDLECMRKYSLQKNVPFWNFFNTMPYGEHTDPTEAQLRWQIYTSLAYGAKGVLYFCYWTPTGSNFPKGGAIIRTDGRRTRHYDQAKRINFAVKNLGPTLMKLTSTGVRRVAPFEDIAKALDGTPIKTLSRVPADPPLDLLLGTFKHEDGRRAVMLNNYSYTFTTWPTVTFDVPHEKVVEVDPQTGQEIPLYDDSPDMPGLQLPLDSGEGRLFLMP